jgi:hypothetical protein
VGWKILSAHLVLRKIAYEFSGNRKEEQKGPLVSQGSNDPLVTEC